MNFCRCHSICQSCAPTRARQDNVNTTAQYGAQRHTPDALTACVSGCASMCNRAARLCASRQYADLTQRPRNRKVLWTSRSHAQTPRPPAHAMPSRGQPRALSALALRGAWHTRTLAARCPRLQSRAITRPMHSAPQHRPALRSDHFMVMSEQRGRRVHARRG